MSGDKSISQAIWKVNPIEHVASNSDLDEAFTIIRKFIQHSRMDRFDCGKISLELIFFAKMNRQVSVSPKEKTETKYLFEMPTEPTIDYLAACSNNDLGAALNNAFKELQAKNEILRDIVFSNYERIEPEIQQMKIILERLIHLCRNTHDSLP
jgi:hypothetical protein